MKRILLKEKDNMMTKDGLEAQWPEAGGYMADLRLLKDVPFSYLVPAEELLPPESIRFFYMDEQWLDALTCGALSLGRITWQDAVLDECCFGEINRSAVSQLAVPRFQKMHPNHRRRIAARKVSSPVRTGFLLRSRLTGRWKALEICGYQEEESLEILRMESLSPEILLCIFDGELTKFVLKEPKTGLRFGTPDEERKITLRDISDTDDLGKPLEGKRVDLKEYTEANGRIHAAALGKEIGRKLGQDVGSSQFAFELIAAAGQVEFRKGDI